MRGHTSTYDVCSPSLLGMLCEPSIHWSFSADPVATADHHCADADTVATQRVGSDCEGTADRFRDWPLDQVMWSWQVWFRHFYTVVLVSNRLKMMTAYWWFMFQQFRLILRYFEVVTLETEAFPWSIQGANSSWKATNPAVVRWQAKATLRQTRWVSWIKTARLFSQDQDNA